MLAGFRWMLLASIGCTTGSRTVAPEITPPPEPTPVTATTSLCENPVDLGNGFVSCASGAVDRRASVALDPSANRLPTCAGDEDWFSCTTDAECTDGPNGQCSSFAPGPFDTGLSEHCGCTYGCSTDADCAVGEACLDGAMALSAGLAWAQCVPAECQTGDDCTSGSCGVSEVYDGCWTSVKLACRTADDTCTTNDDCEGALTCGNLPNTDTYACSTYECVVGRPLRVDDANRRASTTRREDWQDGAVPGVPRDAEVAAHWSAIAADEHASVASFSVVALELLHLGAPPDLLLACHEAAADEVRHAATMYRLASAAAGSPVGPGPLDVRGVTPRTDVEAVLVGLIEEAAVNETLSAGLAMLEASEAQDPTLRALLTGIAHDEQRHAQLAWRTLRWLLDTHPELTDLARTTFATAVERFVAATPSTLHRPTLGILGGDARTRAVSRIADQVVRPAAAALLDA